MARGSIAKNNVTEIIKEAFGTDFITVDGSKIYVQANDGGEKVQIALAMTCPKTPIEISNKNNNTGFPKSAFEDDAETTASTSVNEITPQEQENIRALMERLGL